MCDKWTRRPSNPQLYICLTLTIERDDYKALGLDLRKRYRAVTLPTMADTGCQSCLSGVRVAQQMGLSTEHLIPVSMTMRAANNERIWIIRAAVVRFAGTEMTREGCLGVLEKVPIGTPVMWCHHMGICAKKNGKPRRNVDFQALDNNAFHETHHTQSPFHQPRQVPIG